MSRPPERPPPKLQQIKARALKYPDVARAGLTKTEDGRWAVKLWLRKTVRAPLPDLEEQCEGFPIIYDREPEFPPVARPAYPRRGE